MLYIRAVPLKRLALDTQMPHDLPCGLINPHLLLQIFFFPSNLAHLSRRHGASVLEFWFHQRFPSLLCFKKDLSGDFRDRSQVRNHSESSITIMLDTNPPIAQLKSSAYTH